MRIRKISVAVMAATIALGLSGCFKMVAHYTLHEDDTMSGEALVAMSKDAVEGLGMTVDDINESLGGAENLAGMEGVESQPYDDGSFVGTKYTFKNQPIDSLDQSSGESIVREGDFFIFQGAAPDPGELDQMDEMGGEELLASAEASLSLTFPGKIEDTNGSVKGNTVTWDLLTLKEAPYAKGSAIADGGGGGGVPTWVWIAIAAGVVLLVAAALVRSKSGKGDDAPPAEETKKGADEK